MPKTMLPGHLMITLLGVALLGAAGNGGPASAADPMPSWHDTTAKQAVLAFVERVSTPGSPDFVPVAERIAVFDNDGTLWPENPVPFQAAFLLDELKRMAPEHPEWSDNPALAAALAGDVTAVRQAGPAALAELLAATHVGMTVDEFNRRVRTWLDTARHPRFARRYHDLAYQPMLELLSHLRERGFSTWIVSGGGADFMRVWAEDVYGIPPNQVVGSYSKLRYEMRNGTPMLVKEAGIELIDDKAGKPVGIHRFIGRRPIACFGNSDGDLEMLEYTTIDHTPSLGLIVHHTDGDREYSYDARPQSTGRLLTALEEADARGWIVVDMARDWKTVFRPEP